MLAAEPEPDTDSMFDDQSDDDLVRMSLQDHLTELRRRLVTSVLAVAVMAGIAFALYDQVLDFLTQPYCDILPEGDNCDLVITAPLEGFSARMKVAGYGGLFLASPVVLWQIWRFITPGLHPKEKRYAIPFVIVSALLFVAGAALALATFPKALEFVVDISGDRVTTLFSPEKYITFMLRVILGFGIAFEFPIVLLFLQLAGIVSSRRLLRSWRGAIVLVFAAAAIITPSQDPWTLLAMSLPMTLFYFGAIAIGRFAFKK